MLYLLVGENVYQRDDELARLTAGRAVERLAGDELATERLGEVFVGQTLFSSDVVKVVDGASANKPVWEALMTLVEQSSDTDIILLEQKLDKRTAAYKLLQKQAKVIPCDYWTDRQRAQATRWLREYSRELGVALPDNLVGDMVERAIRPSDTGKDAVIDQQRLARAVQQLKFVEVIDQRALDTILAPSVHENVFGLLAAALDGDTGKVQTMIAHLSRDQDGNRMLGLLGSQAANLTALVLAGSRSVEQVASEIGTHPFALNQFARYRERLDKSDVARVITTLADADTRLKRSQAEPWVLIEKALIEVALQAKSPHR